MEAPQMRGVEEPLLPEPRAVEGGATQSEGAIETQEARYPRLHKTAGLRSLDVWVEISKADRGRDPTRRRGTERPLREPPPRHPPAPVRFHLPGLQSALGAHRARERRPRSGTRWREAGRGAREGPGTTHRTWTRR